MSPWRRRVGPCGAAFLNQDVLGRPEPYLPQNARVALTGRAERVRSQHREDLAVGEDVCRFRVPSTESCPGVDWVCRGSGSFRLRG